jgi:hypothetical protein
MRSAPERRAVIIAKPYVPTNEVQGALTSDFVHGTDNHCHLVSAADFDTGGGYIRVQTTAGDHWCLYEYTGVSTNDLTGLALCTLGVVETEAAYTFPAGAYVYRVCMGEDLDDLIDDVATKIGNVVEDQTPQLYADLDVNGAGKGLSQGAQNVLAVSAGGILTMIKQSGVRAYMGATMTQVIPNTADTLVFLDTEGTDIQGEWDNTVLTGTATSTSANHLVDTSAAFVTADVGRWVWNTTDNTYAKITARNSASDVTLASDIMANTEGYKAMHSTFTATATGFYAVMGGIRIGTSVAAKVVSLSVVVDRATTHVFEAGIHTASTSVCWCPIFGTIYLTAGQIIQLVAYHEFGANATLACDSPSRSWLTIAKIA